MAKYMYQYAQEKSSKWAKIAKCSADTALRDIKDLMEKGILKQEESGGKSTHYELSGWNQTFR